MAWALVEAAGRVDQLRAITSTGLPHQDDAGDSYFVLGPDLSPAGLTWREIYDKIPPNRVLCREITELLREYPESRSVEP